MATASARVRRFACRPASNCPAVLNGVSAPGDGQLFFTAAPERRLTAVYKLIAEITNQLNILAMMP